MANKKKSAADTEKPAKAAKTAKTTKKIPAVKRERSPIEHQIWGVIYMALAVMVSVSLVSHKTGADQNILGPWLGQYLSMGLEFFFGPVPIFLIPFMIFYVGLKMFSGAPLHIASLIFTGAIIFETSLLAAIPDLPKLALDNFTSNGNAFGFLILKSAVLPVFGTAVFGPYFITIIALGLTIVGFLQIDMKQLFTRASAKVAALTDELRAKAEAKKFAEEEAEIRREERLTRSMPAANVSPMRKTTGIPVVEEEPSQAEQDHMTPFMTHEMVEDDQSDFVPPTITTYSDEYVLDEPAEEETDADFNDAAFLEPALVKGGDISEKPERVMPVRAQAQKPYVLPSPDILSEPPAKSTEINQFWIEERSRELMKTLEEFKLGGCKVVSASPGPVVTQFEIQLAPGIQVKKIVNLQDDIALKVGGKAIRIQAPIPGKAAVGIEIPNDDREVVYYKEILMSQAFKQAKAKLPVIVGKSISGKPLIEDIAKMPHVLIAGQTGAGKSVGINSFIASLLFSKTPEELRLILIDPKKVEMACYEGIPHLMSPVVTEPEKAVAALQWGVKEMEYRYRLLAKVGAKNLESFNGKVEQDLLIKFVENGSIEEEENRKLPFVVIIVDELADLMMTASKDVEALVQRIAQLARAVGIHLVVATQRPSVDIITGPIKANLTSRIAFRTIQSQDSRTILGSIGAEKLLGMGDMLYLKNGAPAIERYHGAFISEEDVEKLVEAIKSQGYETGKIEFKAAPKKGDTSDDFDEGGNEFDDDDGERDELFEDVARLVLSNGLASTSMVQRRFKVGYNRAGRIMDQLEQYGIVGPSQGGKVRDILMSKDQFEEMMETIQ